MHRKVIVSMLILFLFANVAEFGVEESQMVAQKNGYVTTDRTRAIYFVNQTLIDLYGYETFSDLFSLIDERFGTVMNITGWSSERFYGHKLEVTVDPSPRTNISDGTGGNGLAHIFWGKDYDLPKMNVTDVAELFLHEMTHGITPLSVMARRWLCEGYASYLSNEVEVLFGDKSRTEVDELYNNCWKRYVTNGYLDFSFNLNRTIQEGYGSFITAWMLNNITQTYGWAAHERFFLLLPDEYLYYMPSFSSLLITESTSYSYYLDSLIVGYYSQAVGTSLHSSFKNWGVKFLPNPITTISVNGTHEQKHAYTSQVMVTLSASGEYEICKVEYSYDQKTWNIYVRPFPTSTDTFLYCRSTDSTGNTGPTTSITLTVESNSPIPTEPFPTISVIVATILSVIVVCAGLFLYLKKRRR